MRLILSQEDLRTVAVLDGTYLIKMTSPEFAAKLTEFLPTYPIYQGLGLAPIDFTLFVDSVGRNAEGGVRKCLINAPYHMVTTPWHSLKKEWAPYLTDDHRQVHSHTGDLVGVGGSSQVKVLMQCGCDATIAALLVELGASPSVQTIVLVSGDQDFTAVVKRVKEDYGKVIARKYQSMSLQTLPNLQREMLKHLDFGRVWW